jgi:alpha/beta superfamily hydrolase
VSRSKGQPKRGHDLVLDGLACMDLLLKRGIKSNNILIHGHSMGGAVATHVRAFHPNGPIISDRSFTSIGAVVEGMVAEIPYLQSIGG